LSGTFQLHIDKIMKGRRRGNAAWANCAMLGRPKCVFRRDEAMLLCEQGMSWRSFAAELDAPVTTLVEECR
jgi:hypothetical protein